MDDKFLYLHNFARNQCHLSMINLLSAENLSKNYGERILFENLNLGLNQGDKTALIAQNGTGKSTLLKILSGYDTPDSGIVVTRKGIRIGYLPQEPVFNETLTIEERIKEGNDELIAVIDQYEEALKAQSDDFTTANQNRLEKAISEMDRKGAWDYEQRLKSILTHFHITDLQQTIKTLSGGQKKRLAMALVLIDNPDILLLDEPTNHLDINLIEWLENDLRSANTTLLMVTHDRYFLDAVCNTIIELDQGSLYTYQGNYSYFLEKRAERISNQEMEVDKATKLMKKELDWINRSPKARTHKSKSRIDAFYQTKEKASQKRDDQEIRLEVNTKRMGDKILELKNISKKYDDLEIIRDFEYLFKKGEKIGIVGENGVGKSTLLNIITGKEEADSGTIIKGETVEFGYYHQLGIQNKDDYRVIDVLTEIAEVIELGNGRSMTASQFLQFFLFPPKTQYTYVSKLSGGEKRRLYLLTVLIKNPNFLILDEPTNDLDLQTLRKLEDFLMEYKGCLLLVSHDRYFLDKLSDHLFIFEENGHIRDYYGSYSQYHQLQEQEEEKKKQKATEQQKKKTQDAGKSEDKNSKNKLTYKEKLEHQSLEKDIEKLETERAELEEKMSSGIADYAKLEEIGQRIKDINQLLDEKMNRWMELESVVSG